MKQAVANEQSGACLAQGVCKRTTTAPTTTLYDGKERVAFQKRADGGVTYSREGDGIAREIRTDSCDTNDAPSECRDDDITDVDAGNMTPALKQGTHPVRGTYRIHFRNEMTGDAETFLVKNAVEVYGTLDSTSARQECAAMLCERNAAECPAPHWAVDGDTGACVPQSSRVSSVRLLE